MNSFAREVLPFEIGVVLVQVVHGMQRWRYLGSRKPSNSRWIEPLKAEVDN